MIAGRIDQRRPAGRRGPGCCRSTGRRAAAPAAERRAAARRACAASRSTRSRQGRSSRPRSRSASARPRSAASRRSRDCRTSTVPMRIIDRPAIGARRSARAACGSRAPTSAQALGLNSAVILDMVEQQHRLMLALDRGAGTPAAGERPQHGGFGRRSPDPAWRPRAGRRAARHQQHLGHALAGEPLQPVLRDAGQLGDALRRRPSFRREILEIGLGLGQHPREARPRLEPLEQGQRVGIASPERHPPCRHRTGPAPPRNRPA